MSTNHTPNFNLCQWEATDPVLRADFNADNQKIDEALQLKGNCCMAAKGYNGTGKYGSGSPCWQYFDRIPRFVVVADRTDGKFFFLIDGVDTAYNPYAPNNPIHVSGNYVENAQGKLIYRIQWYSDTAEHQFNLNNHKYSAIGFYKPE